MSDSFVYISDLFILVLKENILVNKGPICNLT